MRTGKELYPCDPGIAGGVVELVDFFATAMEYAGVEPTEDHFGRSCSRLSPTEACGSVRTPTVKADAPRGGTVRRVALRAAGSRERRLLGEEDSAARR